MTLDPIKTHLANLINFPTVSSTPTTQIVNYLSHHAKSLGFGLKTIPHPENPELANLLCQIGPEQADGLILSGHMDVVPVKGQDWSSDPFVLREENGVYFGRGTADMKGFIAATMHALTQIDLSRLKKQLVLLWTYDEEIGCQGSKIAAPLLAQHLARVPQNAWIGEPTDFKIFRMHAGHVMVRVSAKGKGAHSSNPALGVSAIKALNHVLGEIFVLEQELARESHLPEFFERPYVTLNVGQISGGSAVNVIPDEAQAILGFRPLPNTPIENIFARINEAIKRAPQVPGARVSAAITNETPAMLTEAGTDLEKMLKPHATSSKECAALFATDAGNLKKHGCAPLIFGPGSIDVAHQANEWVKKADLEKCARIIAQVIENHLMT
jgi:acetylornithine deacetylase